MNKTICGLDCDACGWRESSCRPGFCVLKQKLIDEYNALGIPDMDPITQLNVLPGSFVNQEYPLPNGATVHFWAEDRMILCNQVPKKGSSRFYGLAADEKYLLLCEYGADGVDPEIVILKRRKERS